MTRVTRHLPSPASWSDTAVFTQVRRCAVCSSYCSQKCTIAGEKAASPMEPSIVMCCITCHVSFGAPQVSSCGWLVPHLQVRLAQLSLRGLQLPVPQGQCGRTAQVATLGAISSVGLCPPLTCRHRGLMCLIVGYGLDSWLRFWCPPEVQHVGTE